MLNIEREQGSIPMVLLAAIIVAGLIVALFVDVTTGRRLSVDDRDFNQAIQVADAGLQEAFMHLAGLAEVDRPTIGQWLSPAPPEGQLGTGTYSWSAMRVGDNQWQVRSEGEVGDRVRVLEAHMGPLTLFSVAAFGDRIISFKGGNSADSYPVGGRGYVASNGTVRLKAQSDSVDGVTLHGGAVYDGDNNQIRGDGEPEFAPEQALPNIALEEFADGGACSDPNDMHANLADLLPLEEGRVYCVAQADFPGNDHHVITPSGDPALKGEPTVVYIGVGGDLHLQGEGQTNAAWVNMPETWTDTSDPKILIPPATNLEIYLAGGSVRLNNHTKIAAGIYGPATNCSDASNAANAQAEIYGSIVCNEVINQGGWKFSYDERLADVNVDHFSIRSVREEPGGTTSFEAAP